MSNILRHLMFGGDHGAGTPADAYYIFREFTGQIRPEQFHPFICFTGGFSVIADSPGSGKELAAILIGNDWINLCQKQGANTKNALICLASNFDDNMGMVALALELAMIATKERTHPSVKLSDEDHHAVISAVFVKNLGGIQAMASEWGIGLKEGLATDQKRSADDWEIELGYPVLIHPATLTPCTSADGTVLEFAGVVPDENGNCFFHFYLPTGKGKMEVIRSQWFLPKKE